MNTGKLQLRRALAKAIPAHYVTAAMQAVWPIIERRMAELKDRETQLRRSELRNFLNDEMAATTDILKLRKLALCRLGESGYLDYRQRYFDGKGYKAGTGIARLVNPPAALHCPNCAPGTVGQHAENCRALIEF